MYFVNDTGVHMFDCNENSYIAGNTLKNIDVVNDKYLYVSWGNHQLFDLNGNLVMDIGECSSVTPDHIEIIGDKYIEAQFHGKDDKQYMCVLDFDGNFVKSPVLSSEYKRDPYLQGDTTCITNDTSSNDFIIQNNTSSGEFIMPNLIGKQWGEVSAIYANKEVLNITAQLEWSDKPEGEIINQEIPEGRRLKSGSSVVVKVSKGIQQREIQDMSDKTVDAAKEQLEKDGFKVSINRQAHDTVAKDRVISTIPEAHTMAPVGRTVVLIVSSGSNDKPFAMPNVIGIDINDALKRCEEYNLNPKIEHKPSLTERGTVLEQSIAPDTIAYKGDEITLVVSSGETSEVRQEVTILLPQTAIGEFSFKFYVDGELDDDATKIFDIGLLASKTLTYEITGNDGDEKALLVRATSTATEKGDVFYSAQITFENGNAQVSNAKQNDNIFAQLQR